MLSTSVRAQRSSTPKEIDLKPAPRVSLAEQVTLQLQQVILSSLNPGDRLPPERILSERLGVSRIVVREAMKCLVERRLVDIQAGVGTFVRRIEASEAVGPLQLFIDQNRVSMAQLFEVRFVLETAITVRAAEKRGGAALEELRDAVLKTRQVVEKIETEGATPGLIEQFAWIDVRFHMLLASASGNPLFEAVLTPLMDSLLDVRRQGLTLDGTARQALEDHELVLRTVEAGDPGASGEAMRLHLERVRSWVDASDRREGES